MEITMINSPTEETWMEVKARALVTIGKKAVTPPTTEWKHKILEARHSPIRHLMFSFYLKDIPSWVSVHLVRHHVGFQPFVKSQRNDRQNDYDRTKAPQDSPVDMIIDLNAESLMTLANKRLCNQASKETRDVVRKICDIVLEKYPEFEGLLVPMCEYGRCHEMNPCGKYKKTDTVKGLTRKQIITLLESCIDNDNACIMAKDIESWFEDTGDEYKIHMVRNGEENVYTLEKENDYWEVYRPFLPRIGNVLKGIKPWE